LVNQPTDATQRPATSVKKRGYELDSPENRGLIARYSRVDVDLVRPSESQSRDARRSSATHALRL